MNNQNGGAAFPVAAGPGQQFTQGMSLRDWFAGQALIGWREMTGTTFEQDAAAAYKMADYMLAEREKGRQE